MAVGRLAPGVTAASNLGIAAIVLAAGRGTRFGTAPKLLAGLRGKPLVRHAAEAALGSGLAPVLVVTGHHGPAVRQALAGLAVTTLDNPRYAEGLSTSLRHGFAHLPDETQAAIVLLGDMPGVSPSLIRQVAAAWRQAGEPAALIPTHGGRRGNPVLLSRRLAPEIMRLTGDVGAGSILRGRADVVEWETADAGVALDVDTPAALAQVEAVSTTPPRIAE